MKFRTLSLVLSLLVLAAAVSAAPPAAKKKDFNATLSEVMAAWGTLDPSKVAPYYAPETGRVFFDVAPLKYDGWAAYAAGVQKEFAGAKSATLTVEPDARYEVHAKWAWSAATVKFSVNMKTGAQENAMARWTAIWEKRDSGWVIIHDHFSVPQPGADELALGSLYKRLGGYDAIAAVVDDFLGRATVDTRIQRFFVGVSAESQRRIRQLLVDQVCGLAGGPCLYIGRSMKSAHAGLGITDADWQALVGDLGKTLDKFFVADRERGELLKAISTLKSDIVEK